MPVPEAAVDEDDRAVFRQDEVRFAGQGAVFRALDREAVAEAVEHRAQGEFRFRVASTDPGHHLGSLLGTEDIGHVTTQRPDRPGCHSQFRSEWSGGGPAVGPCPVRRVAYDRSVVAP
jgi:hypothetical protein